MKKITITIALAAFFMASCSSGDSNKSSESSSTQNATSEPTTTAPTEAPAATASAAVTVPDDVKALLEKNTCLSCHDANDRVVGPPYKEIAKRNYTNKEIVELIYKPKPSNWPDYTTPMVGLPNVPKEEASKIADWIISLNK
jgi:cytochrome c551/c552